MGVLQERKLLELDGFVLSPFLSYLIFSELWKRHVNKETNIKIIKEFWEDYLTSTSRNYEHYFQQIER